MSDADESTKLALELVRIFKELPLKDQAATLEFVKKLREKMQV